MGGIVVFKCDVSSGTVKVIEVVSPFLLIVSDSILISGIKVISVNRQRHNHPVRDEHHTCSVN
jgi:hypothetical protein